MSTAFATTVKWTAGAIAVWGASSILYKYFMAKPKKLLSKKKTLEILTKIMTELDVCVRTLAQKEQAVRQQVPDEETFQMVYEQLTQEYRSAQVKAEAGVLSEFRVSKAQVAEAVAAYGDDAAIQTMMKHFRSLSARDEKASSEVPADMTLERAVKIISEVLELSITCMEEITPQLAAEFNYQRGSPMPPPLVARINKTYSTKYPMAREQLFKRYKVDEDIIAATAHKYQNTPEFRNMIAQHHKEKTSRFAALGLAVASSD